MYHRRTKLFYFLLAWLNVYATSYFFNYLFFCMRRDFGFGNRENLLLAALNGFVYMLMAWAAGKFAQKRGYFKALRVGFITMALALGIGSQLPGVSSQFVVMVVWTFGMCFTWPTLEALVSERETRAGLAQMVGIYNVVWSSGAAVAYFTGGALLEKLGRASLFWLPVSLHLTQLALTLWLEKRAAAIDSPVPAPALEGESGDFSPPAFSRSDEPAGTAVLELEPATATATLARPARAKAFLRMAWLANPFAYIAMNTILPLLPDVAARLRLSTTLAGFLGSVWLFARMGAFIGLWQWTGWHYRFRWLVSAYGLMVLCFAALLLVPSLPVIIAAEVVFGLCVGLIYYSSLFYSMDVGDTKGEHGGFHEALIGLGIFAGPAVGTMTLRLAPQVPHAGIWAVSGLLVVGLGGLVVMRGRVMRDA